jgi:hypothetical protein
MFSYINATDGQVSRYNAMLTWLPMDNTVGDPIDSSGYGVGYTRAGSPTQGVAGKFGKAFTFDGVDDTCTAANANLVNSFDSATAVSIAFWASAVDFYNTDCAVSIADVGTTNALSIYPYFDPGGMNPADQVRVWYNNEYIMTIAAPHLADGSYNHFCYIQRDATTHEMYVNNVLVGTSAISKTMVTTIDRVCIGTYDLTTEFFTGNLDNVKIWNRGIEVQELREEFLRG